MKYLVTYPYPDEDIVCSIRLVDDSYKATRYEHVFDSLDLAKQDVIAYYEEAADLLHVRIVGISGVNEQQLIDRYNRYG